MISSDQASAFSLVKSSSDSATWPACDNLDSQVSVLFNSPLISCSKADLFLTVGTGWTILTTSTSLTSLLSPLYLASW